MESPNSLPQAHGARGKMEAAGLQQPLENHWFVSGFFILDINHQTISQTGDPLPIWQRRLPTGNAGHLTWIC